MKKYVRKFFSLFSFLLFFIVCSTSYGEEIKRVWNLKGVNLTTLIAEVAKETGYSFAVSPQVTGKVTFISGQPLSREELYQTFLALLQSSGYEVIKNGNIVKIIPNAYIKEEATKVTSPSRNKKNDEMAVTVVRVKYISASELVKSLRQLVFHFGYIEVYQPTNDIIICDHANNISRIIQLIHSLDKSSASDIEVIHLEYAQANDLVNVLSSLLQQKGTGSGITLADDERSNDILIYGGTPEQRTQVRTLIKKLDVRLNKKGMTTAVIYLKYLRAEKVAVILKSLIENYIREKGGQPLMTQAGGLESSTGKQPEQGQSYQANFANLTSQADTFAPNSSQGSTPGKAAADFSQMKAKERSSGSVSPYIQWEESTNSLIVSAPADLIVKLKGIIARIDIRRPQVLIEAVIAEVEVERARELGIEINTGGNPRILTRFGSTMSLSGIGQNNALAISNPPTPKAIGQGLTGMYLSGQSIRFLLRALETDSRSNILSTPNIVTLDNEPAQIKVGQRISFNIGQIQNSPTGGNPFNFFNQQDVGLILTINPQITPDGSIKLVIEQELSNVLPGQVSAGNNPNLSERFIHTTVMANNGDIIVLGGLIQDRWQEVISQVPFIGDVPVLGAFFRNKQKQLVKQNLMIFLRPTILYEDKETVHIIGSKYEYLRQQQLATEKNISAQNEMTPPVLPPWGDQVELPLPFKCLLLNKCPTRCY